MRYFDWLALIIGAGLIVSGARAIRRRRARSGENYEGPRAVCLGWVWIGMGTLFILGVVFDSGVLKIFFRAFLQAAN